MYEIAEDETLPELQETVPEVHEIAEDALAPEIHDIDDTGTSTKIPWVGFDGRIELLDSDDPIFEETLSETSEDETMPEVYEITDGVFEEAANLMLTLYHQNETEKHGKSSEIQRHIEVVTRRAIWHFVEEIYRGWRVSPTPETMCTSVDGILGASYDF